MATAVHKAAGEPQVFFFFFDSYEALIVPVQQSRKLTTLGGGRGGGWRGDRGRAAGGGEEHKGRSNEGRHSRGTSDDIPGGATRGVSDLSLSHVHFILSQVWISFVVIDEKWFNLITWPYIRHTNVPPYTHTYIQSLHVIYTHCWKTFFFFSFYWSTSWWK